MYNIKLMNKISASGTDVFSKQKYNVGAEIDAPVALMVRSAKLHDMQFDKETIAISRAGAGVNNIPCDRCADEGIVVFNTPGANANAVKELTLAALLLASRDIVGGIAWAEALEANDEVGAKVEAGKGAFAGCELFGKTLGVIGLGAIGGLVANAGVKLGMKVIGYDPHLSVSAAWNLSGLSAGLVASLLSVLIRFAPVNLALFLLSYGMMFWAIFRGLSRNTYKRYQENRKFLQLTGRLKDREHRYFDCPKCRQMVRVPRGKGKISITCPRCREKFVKKT